MQTFYTLPLLYMHVPLIPPMREGWDKICNFFKYSRNFKIQIFSINPFQLQITLKIIIEQLYPKLIRIYSVRNVFMNIVPFLPLLISTWKYVRRHFPNYCVPSPFLVTSSLLTQVKNILLKISLKCSHYAECSF